MHCLGPQSSASTSHRASLPFPWLSILPWPTSSGPALPLEETVPSIAFVRLAARVSEPDFVRAAALVAVAHLTCLSSHPEWLVLAYIGLDRDSFAAPLDNLVSGRVSAAQPDIPDALDHATVAHDLHSAADQTRLVLGAADTADHTVSPAARIHLLDAVGDFHSCRVHSEPAGDLGTHNLADGVVGNLGRNVVHVHSCSACHHSHSLGHTHRSYPGRTHRSHHTVAVRIPDRNPDRTHHCTVVVEAAYTASAPEPAAAAGHSMLVLEAHRLSPDHTPFSGRRALNGSSRSVKRRRTPDLTETCPPKIQGTEDTSTDAEPCILSHDQVQEVSKAAVESGISVLKSPAPPSTRSSKDTHFGICRECRVSGLLLTICVALADVVHQSKQAASFQRAWVKLAQKRQACRSVLYCVLSQPCKTKTRSQHWDESGEALCDPITIEIALFSHRMIDGTRLESFN